MFKYIMILASLFSCQQDRKVRHYKESDTGRWLLEDPYVHVATWNEKWLADLNLSHLKSKISTFKSDHPHPKYYYKKNFNASFSKNGQYQKAQAGSVIGWSSNRFGLKDSSIKRPKPKGQLRIVCLGASTTEGANLSNHQSWPNLLNKSLQKKYPHIRVINAGFLNALIEDQLHYYSNIISQLTPDIVFFHGGHNNIVYQMPLKPKDCHSPRCFKEAFNNKIEKIKLKYDFGRLSVDEIKKLAPLHEVDWEIFQFNSHTYLKKVLELSKKVKADGAQFIGSTIINRCDTNIKNRISPLPPTLKSELYEIFFPFDGTNFSKLNQTFNTHLKSFFKKHSLPLYDLASDFKMSDKYFQDDCIHFSAQGNKQIAQIMEYYIIENFIKKRVPSN